MKKTFFLHVAALALVAYSGAALPADPGASAASICPKAEAYKPSPPPPAKQPALPTIPSSVTPPIKIGDAFTVRGAMHHLRSKVHGDEVYEKQISIVGYIVKTNYGDAPPCAVHRTGKADPVTCAAPVPAFWIADDKGETSATINVLGWASNFAQIFSLIEAIDRAPAGKEQDVKLMDEFWGHTLPNPVPNVGAKVKITGTYGIAFMKVASSRAVDTRHGILTAEKIEYLEPPSEKAYLPGMKRKK